MELTQQFQNGICKVCGEDHRDVMRLKTLSFREANAMIINSDPKLKKRYCDIYLNMFDCYIDKIRPEHLHSIDLQLSLNHIEKCKTRFYANSNFQRMITLNFKKGTDIKKQIEILNLKLGTISWLKNAKFVVENYTKDGEHPHIHMMIKSYSKPKKSAIIKQFSIWLNIDKNFIDVRRVQNQGYCEGLKTELKKGYLEKDHTWRELNGIKHLYN